MRKTVTLLLALCLLLSSPMTCFAVGDTQEASAGSTVITTDVPSTHTLTVETEYATVSYHNETGTTFAVPRLDTFTLTVSAEEGYVISAVYLNDENVTASLTGETLILSGIYEDAVLTVSTVSTDEVSGGTTFSGVLYDLPEQDFPDESLLYKVAVDVSGLTEVPEELKSNPDLNTVEKITEVLKTVLIDQCGYPEANMVVYEVKLVVSEDNGETWEAASAEHFPENGLTIILPYPDGTSKDSHDFAATHMFTSTAFWKTPGDTENPAVTKIDDGLQMTVTGLSPIAIAWADVEAEAETETKIETETETEISASVDSAQTGDVNPIGAWFVLLLLSAAALLIIGGRKFKGRPNA